MKSLHNIAEGTLSLQVWK